jgi:hypothetical protein
LLLPWEWIERYQTLLSFGLEKGGNVRRLQRISLILLTLALVAVLADCRPDQLCCLTHDPETDQATYCNNHRDAVLKFVREISDVAERRARLTAFEQLYATLDHCQTVACIESVIEADTALSGFGERYQNEHRYAERDTDIPQEQKAGLILCGFKHAIDGQKQTLGEGE